MLVPRSSFTNGETGNNSFAQFPSWPVPTASSLLSHYLFIVRVKARMKKKKTAYNLHFKTATMTNYAYLSMRGGQNWSRHLGFPFSIKFRGETQPWSPRLPRSVRSDAEPRAEADFKERLSSSTDVSQHGPRRALDLIQPSQCDTQK